MATATRPPSHHVPPVFVARQPIYTGAQRIYGYELLFRDSPANVFPDIDPSRATAQLLTTTILTAGLDRLSDGRPLLINFPRELLISEAFRLLPPERVVIEVLEDVPPDAEVIHALEVAKASGHTIALDDIIAFEPGYAPMYELADILKVDFRQTTPEQRRSLSARFAPYGTTLLAEKIETGAEIEEALALGYELLQGYALGRPRVMRTRRLEALNASTVELLRLASEPVADFSEMERVISSDVSLTYRLMRVVNSAANGLSQRVTAIRHAISMLGQAEMLRAASLLVLASASDDRPGDLAASSLTRARCMEMIALDRWPDADGSSFYLAGLFSRLDTLLDVPMAEALARLPLSTEIEHALLGEAGRLREVLELVACYEQADWDAVAARSAALGIAPDILAGEYPGAVAEADRVLSSI